MIRGLDTVRWSVLSPYLDEALDRSGAERAAWLERLRARDGALAEEIEELLADHDRAQAEGFLEISPQPRATLAGQTLGAYTLREPIGHGGMGSVWLADRSDGRYEGVAAVKLLNASLIGLDAEDRFRREGRILARLRHAHIAQLIDAGVSPAGQPYLVLEHIDGEDITAYCDRRRLGLEARVHLFRDMLAAVAHAHANLIVHRDLKPSNVLVDRNGTVKLLDFGVAKLLTSDASAEPPTLTLESGAWVTPEYAAPEQLTSGTITTATDVFALGVLLYKLFSGRHPAGSVSRDSPAEFIRLVLDREPARLSAAVEAADDGPESMRARAADRGTTGEALRRALRGDLETIVAKALKRDASERYASVVALDDDLRRYLEHVPIGARPDRFTYRAAKFVRRHRLPVALASVLLAALAAGMAGTIWQSRVAARERDAAGRERDVAARERDQALVQLERADMINDFTSFLLAQAVPVDKPVSVRDILERAERMAEKRSVHDPALTVDMLVNIGHIYATRDENDNARRTLKRAYELSQALDDPAIRAIAACSWAVAVDMDGNQTGALRLIEEGLGFTSPEARFNGPAVSCLVHRATIGLRHDSAQLVSASAQEALRRLDQRPAAYQENRATALQLAAAGHRLAGETAEADRMYARALEQVRRIGREDTLQESAILNNWALNIAQTSPLRAIEMYLRVIELLGGKSADSMPVPPLINYAVQLMRVGRHAEARAILERARDVARRHGQAQRGGVVDMRLALACRELGDLSCARASLLAAEKGLLAGYPEGHRFRGDLVREQALLAEAEGRHQDAHRLLLDAQEIHSRITEKSVTQIETLLELSRFELGRGSTAEAETHARSALASAEAFRGGVTHSAWVGRSLLALGAAREAEGDGAGAREMRSRAVEHMAPTLGEGHPDVVEARRLLGS